MWVRLGRSRRNHARTQPTGREVIVINNEIHLVVVDVGNGRARLGISAPESVRVDRKEVQERRGREPAAGIGGDGSRELRGRH